MSSATEHATDPEIERETGPEDTKRETGRDDIEREISHDEFDPVGTLALILIYFVIIATLWVFMYFVEFLGRGPTVV